MYFDVWGREKRVCPQPPRPANEGSISVKIMCSYSELRKKFKYLPDQLAKTDKARKKQAAEQKIHKQAFFLPNKEKRKILIKAEMDRAEAKKSKKQKEAERCTGDAFAREFGCTLHAAAKAEEEDGTNMEEMEFVTEIPGPGTDESESEDEVGAAKDTKDWIISMDVDGSKMPIIFDPNDWEGVHIATTNIGEPIKLKRHQDGPHNG
jgi:hypothetical protein